MSATLLDDLIEAAETPVSCKNCPIVQHLERALETLQAKFQLLEQAFERLQAESRCDVGYWKSRHADSVKRIEQLKEELDQARGETRTLQDKLFGRKSEKSTRGDRSNDLVDPEEVSAAAKKKRGAQPGHAGHGRRDYSHLPVQEEFVPLPEESLACPHCGKPVERMSVTEDSELLEVDVRPHRRKIRRRRYRATCAMRSHTANLDGSVAAQADPQRQLRHFDLGACVIGQVFVLSAHGTVTGAIGTVRIWTCQPVR